RIRLRSSSPPPQSKKPLPPPPTAEEGVGDEARAESRALIKRKRAPSQSPEATGAKHEGIIDLTVGREQEGAAGGATNTEATQNDGEPALPDISLLGDDVTLREFLISWNKINVR
ncbi:hypothetical protein Dimus_013467, partial [Dionaea muscipula]